MMSDPQIRTATKTRTRRRRLSACHRLCIVPTRPSRWSCSSFGQVEIEKVVVTSRQTRGHDVASSSAAAPELRWSKSVAAVKDEVLNVLATDPRRKSCDVRSRCSL
ncbi:hypothetical protein L6452_18844 [Arctium lappa]|uniref:Uncharacterized protein n=1 Tax=Arctium lappa TaxID=4217 RepID=A0ACB9C7K9_ARCLA|nr:hypothetical protein L6452_18844 [Arctium lappa]